MREVLWMLVLLVNLATFAVFGFDKWRAGRQGRRVRERTLLWWMFATGWIGGWVAKSMFRHKTEKATFHRWAITWTIVNPFWALVWWTFLAK